MNTLCNHCGRPQSPEPDKTEALVEAMRLKTLDECEVIVWSELRGSQGHTGTVCSIIDKITALKNPLRFNS